jgi:hypothetical protein
MADPSSPSGPSIPPGPPGPPRYIQGLRFTSPSRTPAQFPTPTVRQSPIGAPEIVDPQYFSQYPNEIVAVTSPPARPGKMSEIRYRSQAWADAPGPAAHERIHAAQFQLPMRSPGQELADLYSRANSPLAGHNQPFPEDEVPAYALDGWGQEPVRPSLARDYYLDRMKQLNNGYPTEKLEVALPPASLRDYVRNHPQPVRFPKNPILSHK